MTGSEEVELSNDTFSEQPKSSVTLRFVHRATGRGSGRQKWLSSPSLPKPIPSMTVTRTGKLTFD